MKIRGTISNDLDLNKYHSAHFEHSRDFSRCVGQIPTIFLVILCISSCFDVIEYLH